MKTILRSDCATSALPASLLAISLAFAPQISHAAAGAQDMSFGTGGVLTTPLTSTLGGQLMHAAALQKDGKMLFAARHGDNVGVARYNADGTLDTGFGESGMVLRVFAGQPGPQAVVDRLIVQPDGKILVLGQTGWVTIPIANRTALARLNADGTPDTAFGNNGIVNFDFGHPVDHAPSMALQHDGRILLVGSYRSPKAIPGVHQLFLARLQANGQPDTGFGSAGVVREVFPNKQSEGMDVVVQPDGRIVVVGNMLLPNSLHSLSLKGVHVALMRFLPDGQLDSSFAQGGMLFTMLGSPGAAMAKAVVLQPDGRILVGGKRMTNATNTSDVPLFSARFDSAGNLDTSFGNGGLAIIQPDAHITLHRNLNGFQLQPDGRILMSAGNIGSMAVMARLLPDGRPDPSFDGDSFRSDIISYPSHSLATELQPDGHALLTYGTLFHTPHLWKHLAKRFALQDLDNDGIGDPWDLEPDPLQLKAPKARTGQLVTTGFATVSGLGESVRVPVVVENAEYALNGSTEYSTGIGYVGNGDTINLRYVAGSQARLLVGGMHERHNSSLILGPQVAATFGSATGKGFQVKVVVPAAEHLNAVPQTTVSAVFSDKVDLTTINGTNFQLRCNGQPVTGAIRVTGDQVAWLRPAAALPAGAICQATLLPGIRSAGGVALPAPYRWSFMVNSDNPALRSGR